MTQIVNVWFSTNENAWLSNLAARPISDKYGRKFVSVEHAYQTYKSGRFDEATYNADWQPGRKIVGKLGTKTEGDWNIRLMERLILASVEQNQWFCDDLYILQPDVKFTHTRDKGIWKTEFPRILKMAQNHAQEICNQLKATA